MKLVVEIDEATYKDIKKGKIYSSIRDVPLESVNAIANGTRLPKGHGHLIDADAYAKKYDTNINGRIGKEYVFAPTIIEADNTESEDK